MAQKKKSGTNSVVSFGGRRLYPLSHLVDSTCLKIFIDDDDDEVGGGC